MTKYLTLEQVLKMHEVLIEKFGGLHSVRDINLLISAIETPKAASFVTILLMTATKGVF
jgi:death-on-curing protein